MLSTANPNEALDPVTAQRSRVKDDIIKRSFESERNVIKGKEEKKVLVFTPGRRRGGNVRREDD